MFVFVCFLYNFTEHYLGYLLITSDFKSFSSNLKVLTSEWNKKKALQQ